MFSFKMERSRSDSSTSSFSSALSLSPSGWTPRATLSPATTTTTPLGGSPELLVLAKPATFSTTITRSSMQPKRTLTAPSVYETFCPSSGRGAFGYPCWPAGESLSAGSSPNNRRPQSVAAVPATPSTPSTYASFSFQPPTSRISDDDLEQLDFSGIAQPPEPEEQSADAQQPDLTIGGPQPEAYGISWSQVGGANNAPSAQQQLAEPRRRRLPPPPPGMAMGDVRRRKRVPSRSTSRGAATRRRVSQAV